MLTPWFNRHRMCCVAVATMMSALGLRSSAALAQSPNYPTRPIKLVLPFGAGGSTDVIARLLGNRVGETLGQQLIIENKPGADGDLGAESVARSPADGYTLLMTTQSMAVNHSLRPKRAYKVEDLAPIMLLADTQAVLVVPAASPAKSVAELIALAKSQPGKLDYGSAGVGTSGHMAMELFRLTAGIDVVHVPFRNIGQWMTDTIAGRIAISMPTVPGATTHIRGGKVRALGVTGIVPSKALLGVPTISSSGVPGYSTVTWYGLFAPRGTSETIIARVQSTFADAVRTPAIAARLEELGLEPKVSSTTEFATLVTSEVVRWAKVVREAGIKAE